MSPHPHYTYIIWWVGVGGIIEEYIYEGKGGGGGDNRRIHSHMKKVIIFLKKQYFSRVCWF